MNLSEEDMEDITDMIIDSKDIEEELTADEKIKELNKIINTIEKEKNDWIKAYQEEKDKQFDILRNSIPKQKIIDKIEEINEDEESKYYDTFLDARDIYHAIKILEKILEDK